MSKVSTKRRILDIKEIFKNDTDLYTTLSVDDLIDRLKREYRLSLDIDFDIDRKAILDDIKELEDTGFKLKYRLGEHKKKMYYFSKRAFNIYELRLLIDAVSSARFITRDDTKTLVDKIKGLTSKGLAKKLQNQMIIDEMVKSESSNLKRYLHKMHTAILQNKELIFRYGNYDVNKKFVLHHNGDYYTVEPYALVWNSDYYYLVCRDLRRDKIINYRVDRMRDVRIQDKVFKKPDINIAELIKRSFNMYSGEEDAIRIKFVNKLINVVIDRFGTGITVIKTDENHFEIRVHAAINEGLLRWILTWGADAKVIYPETLVDMVKKESERMYDLYH